MSRKKQDQEQDQDQERDQGQGQDLVPSGGSEAPLPYYGQRNPFEEFGEGETQRTLVGRLLKFNKGEYWCGDRQLPVGTRLVALMDQLLAGWVKWEDGQPVDQVMGRVVDRYVVPPRETMGDNERDLWPLDSNGRPWDPWQNTRYLVLKDPGAPLTPSHEHEYTLPLSSDGGRKAVGQLSTTYGKAMRQRPDEWPVVELGMESYPHKNPQFGRIKKPTLFVVGWEAKE